jgi:hypothetical protein
MIAVCEYFAEEFCLNFNATKSVSICYGSKKTPAGFTVLNNEQIPWSSKCVHLGHVVTSDGKFDNDVTAKICTFVSSVNRLIGNFGSQHFASLKKLFNAYCSCFYGGQLWPIDSRNEARVAVAWNKAVRRVFGLPRRCHTWLLGPLLGRPHLTKQMHVRVFKFCRSLLMSNNAVVKTIVGNSLFDARSPIGHNIARIREVYFASPLINDNILAIRGHEFDDAKLWKIEFLQELILCREGSLNVPLDRECISTIIEHVTCD